MFMLSSDSRFHTSPNLASSSSSWRATFSSIGYSPRNSANAAFRAKFDFPFPLLCDTERSLGLAYGACTDAKAATAKRVSVVIGPAGRVLRFYEKVDARAHPQQILDDLE